MPICSQKILKLDPLTCFEPVEGKQMRIEELESLMEPQEGDETEAEEEEPDTVYDFEEDKTEDVMEMKEVLPEDSDESSDDSDNDM